MSDKRLSLNGTFGSNKFRSKPKCKNTGVNTLINMQNTNFYNAFGSEDNGGQGLNTPISSILFASIDKTGQKYPIRAEKCVGTQNTVAELGSGDTVINSGKTLDGCLEVWRRPTMLHRSSSGLLHVSSKEPSEIDHFPLSVAGCEANTDECCAHSECMPFLYNAKSATSSSLVLPSTTQDSECNESRLLSSTSTRYPSSEEIYHDEPKPSSEKLSPLTLDINDVCTTQVTENVGTLLSSPNTVHYPSFEELLAIDYDITLEDLAILLADDNSQISIAEHSEYSGSPLPSTIFNYPSFEELYPDEHEVSDEECASPLLDKNLDDKNEEEPPFKK